MQEPFTNPAHARPQASPRSGEYRPASTLDETVWAFHPHPLPPDPPLDLTEPLRHRLAMAAHALGGLDAIGQLLPDPDLFLYMYVRKEAVLSSQIEGTQSSLSDLLFHEAASVPGVPIDDVEETSAYVRALNHGVARIQNPAGLPLSLRLLRDVHRILLGTSRGAAREPGEFRRSQNWIGGTRPGNASFVPPPWPEAREALVPLEQYLHLRNVDPVVKAALAHAQFETIHPFLDGNGRIGRMLVTFVLCNDGILRLPVLYLSLYLKQHRERYYELLMRVREDGAWEDWLAFFAEGIEETARTAQSTTSTLHALFDRDRNSILHRGRAATNALRVFDELTRRAVVVDVAWLARRLNVTRPTVYSAIGVLEELGIASEVSGQQRGRVWAYPAYLDVLNAGTEQA